MGTQLLTCLLITILQPTQWVPGYTHVYRLLSSSPPNWVPGYTHVYRLLSSSPHNGYTHVYRLLSSSPLSGYLATHMFVDYYPPAHSVGTWLHTCLSITILQPTQWLHTCLSITILQPTQWVPGYTHVCRLLSSSPLSGYLATHMFIDYYPPAHPVGTWLDTCLSITILQPTQWVPGYTHVYRLLSSSPLSGYLATHMFIDYYPPAHSVGTWLHTCLSITILQPTQWVPGYTHVYRLLSSSPHNGYTHVYRLLSSSPLSGYLATHMFVNYYPPAHSVGTWLHTCLSITILQPTQWLPGYTHVYRLLSSSPLSGYLATHMFIDYYPPAHSVGTLATHMFIEYYPPAHSVGTWLHTCLSITILQPTQWVPGYTHVYRLLSSSPPSGYLATHMFIDYYPPAHSVGTWLHTCLLITILQPTQWVPGYTHVYRLLSSSPHNGYTHVYRLLSSSPLSGYPGLHTCLSITILQATQWVPGYTHVYRLLSSSPPNGYPAIMTL